jgi:hypothetical protein
MNLRAWAGLFVEFRAWWLSGMDEREVIGWVYNRQRPRVCLGAGAELSRIIGVASALKMGRRRSPPDFGLRDVALASSWD